MLTEINIYMYLNTLSLINKTATYHILTKPCPTLYTAWRFPYIFTFVIFVYVWHQRLTNFLSFLLQYGISGPFWYATGATIQILLFSMLAVQLKIRAPGAKTFLQVIKARFGSRTHVVFCVFALMTNVIVTAMLMLGKKIYLFGIVLYLVASLRTRKITVISYCSKNLLIQGQHEAKMMCYWLLIGLLNTARNGLLCLVMTDVIVTAMIMLGKKLYSQKLCMSIYFDKFAIRGHCIGLYSFHC